MAITLDGTTGTTTPALTDSALTSGRVTYAGTSGVLQDSANLVFDGTNLGIGVASPAVPLEIDKNAGEALRLAATGANQSIYSRYIAGSPNTGNLYVGVDTAAGAVSGLNGAGLLWQNGNNTLAFGTNNALAMTLTQSGTLILKGGSSSATDVGITFPATQSASTDPNTLDDYEEGTWTPTGTAITLSSATGYYTKIGRMVYCQYDVTFPTTSNTGGAEIGSMPFTIFAGNSANSSGAGSIHFYNGSINPLQMYLGGQSTSFRFISFSTNKTNADMSTSRVMGQVIYFV